MKMTPERIAAARELVASLRENPAGVVAALGTHDGVEGLAQGLGDTLDDLENLQRAQNRAEDLLVELLEVLALRKAGGTFQARVREPVVVRKVGKYLESCGKLSQVLDYLPTLERVEP